MGSTFLKSDHFNIILKPFNTQYKLEYAYFTTAFCLSAKNKW